MAKSNEINTMKDFKKYLPYQLLVINSADIDTSRYQRGRKEEKVRRIVSEFNELIANEPKVSFRDNKFYVFDGQHTIEARKRINSGNDVDIVCKVYFDLTEEDEARLFAAQTGYSSRPTPGTTLKARVIGKDKTSIDFVKVNESLNLKTSFSSAKGDGRITCINTAYKTYLCLGDKKYKETMAIIIEAWGGIKSSLYSDVITTIGKFVGIYYGEYDRSTLVYSLSGFDPYEIVIAINDYNPNHGIKKALSLILENYNLYSGNKKLPERF